MHVFDFKKGGSIALDAPARHKPTSSQPGHTSAHVTHSPSTAVIPPPPITLKFAYPRLDVSFVGVGDLAIHFHQTHRLVRCITLAYQHTTGHRHTAVHACLAMGKNSLSISNDRQGCFHATP